MAYARGTTVEADKTISQLGSMLQRAGAAKRSFGTDDERGVARVQFELSGVLVMLTVPLPKLEEFKYQPQSTWKTRPKDLQQRLHAQACRERWRQLLLIVKAKLEAISVGLSTVEREFLADVQTPSGETIHEMLQRLTGDMPIATVTNGSLMLGMGER